jgi:acetyltransferase
VPVLSTATQAALRGVLPEFGAAANPIDVTGAFLAEPRILAESVRIALEDPAVDVGVIWLQLMHGHADRLVELFRQIRREVKKPILLCWLEAPERCRQALMADGIAVLSATERTIDAAKGLVDWGAALRRHRDRRVFVRAASAPVPHGDVVETVPSTEASALLEGAGLRTVASRLATDEDAAVDAAESFGFPVAVKVESAAIPHKTEAGGVVLGLRDPAAVRSAVRRVLAGAREHAPGAAIDGVLVQRMAAPGTEIVLGLSRDPVFGPIVMVGLGGIFVEVLKDVAFARVPVDEPHAHDMLDRLAGRAILDGARGRPAVDRKALARAIVAISNLALAHPEIRELDVNPVFAGPDGVVAVDWLMRRTVASRV